MEHRGEIIEKAIRESGIPISTIAKRLGKTRQWLYLVFQNPNVSLDLVLEVGKIIYHDFKDEISQLNQFSSNIKESAEKYEINSYSANYWKEKYFKLMEEHHLVISELAKLKK
jgi:ABC-type glutathione transport system ATPase component